MACAVYRTGMPAIVADYDWSMYDRILDIGGAYGSVDNVLAALMQANPAARGVLFDLRQVVERAQKVCCHVLQMRRQQCVHISVHIIWMDTTAQVRSLSTSCVKTACGPPARVQ